MQMHWPEKERASRRNKTKRWLQLKSSALSFFNQHRWTLTSGLWKPTNTADSGPAWQLAFMWLLCTEAGIQTFFFQWHQSDFICHVLKVLTQNPLQNDSWMFFLLFFFNLTPKMKLLQNEWMHFYYTQTVLKVFSVSFTNSHWNPHPHSQRAYTKYYPQQKWTTVWANSNSLL